MNNWIKAKDVVPDNHRAVLVYCPERKNIYTAIWEDPFWVYFGGSFYNKAINEPVDYWMNLPTPPNE